MGLFSGMKHKGGPKYAMPAGGVGWGYMPPEYAAMFDPYGVGGQGGPMPELPPQTIDVLGQRAPMLKKPDAPRRRGGLGGVLRGIGNALERISPEDLAAARATIGGDYATAARFQMAGRTRREEQREARQTAARQRSLFNNLVKQGMDPGLAEVAVTDPQSLARNVNERFGSFNVGEGDSLFHGGFDGQPNVWRAPKTYEQGSDMVNVDFSGGVPRETRVAGMTAAEQEARSLGLQPGTPGFNLYVRDRNLNAQGPTGYQMHREDNAVSERNNIRSTGVSRENNVRSNDTSRANAATGAATSRANNADNNATSRTNAQGGAQQLTGQRYVYPDGSIRQYDLVSQSWVVVGRRPRR